MLDGRFGAYVTDGSVNATVPRGITPTELTLDEAVGLLRARADAAPSTRRTAKKAAKKPAKKKATKKVAKKPAKKKVVDEDCEDDGSNDEHVSLPFGGDARHLG